MFDAEHLEDKICVTGELFENVSVDELGDDAVIHLWPRARAESLQRGGLVCGRFGELIMRAACATCVAQTHGHLNFKLAFVDYRFVL